MNKILTLDNITFDYGISIDNPLVDNLSMDFTQNKIHIILGPSGSGKTTLLNLIAKVLKPTLGKISYKENGEGYLLTQRNLDFFDLQYVPDGLDKKDPTLSPIFTKDFKNLPIAFIATAQYDPLRDEGYEYAKLLKKEGVQTQYIEYKNMVHGFFNIPKIGEEAMQCYKDVNQFIATNF